MENELMTSIPDQSAEECYALVFDCDLDANVFENIRAVVAIGKLTHEQFCRLPREFERRYRKTGTKSVSFVLEQTWYAFCLSADISENIPRYRIEDLYKQNEVIIKQNDAKFKQDEATFDVIRKILEALTSIDNKTVKEDDRRRKNVLGAESANKKLSDLLEVRSECKSWKSAELGKLIGATDATIRKTAKWQEISKRKRIIREINKIVMQLRNDYLSEAKREELEDRLKNLEDEFRTL